MSNMIKILVAGDGGVGKTTLLNTLIKGKYNDQTQLTIGIELFIKDVSIESRDLTLQIWDLGGQKRFKSLHEKCQDYIEGTKGAILIFDLTRMTTLENLNYWTNIIRSKDKNVPILFIGSKLDLQDGENANIDYILKLKDDMNFFNYIQISSKTKHNIDKVFDILIREIISRNLI